MREISLLLSLTLLGVLIVLGSGCGQANQVPRVAPPINPPSEEVDDPAEGAVADLGEPEDAFDPNQRTTEELMDLLEKEQGLHVRKSILETIVLREPNNRTFLLMLMDVLERIGLDLALGLGQREESKPWLYRAAELARMVLQFEEPLLEYERKYIAEVFYNEACNFALDGDSDRALDSLREALELGFADPILFTDDELDSLRGLDSFQELIEMHAGQFKTSSEEEHDDANDAECVGCSG